MKKTKHIVLLVLLLLGDQISKIFAVVYLKGKETITLIPKVLSLQYHENTGAAFGIMEGKQIFLTILTVVIILLVLFVFFSIPDEKKYKPLTITLLLLIAGAIGNLIDRILNGYVVDFIYFKLINFPIFNIADSYVTVSTILIILLSFFYYKEEDFKFISRAFSRKNKKE